MCKIKQHKPSWQTLGFGGRRIQPGCTRVRSESKDDRDRRQVTRERPRRSSTSPTLPTAAWMTRDVLDETHSSSIVRNEAGRATTDRNEFHPASTGAEAFIRGSSFDGIGTWGVTPGKGTQHETWAMPATSIERG